MSQSAAAACGGAEAEHDECMICLSPLLAFEDDGNNEGNNADDNSSNGSLYYDEDNNEKRSRQTQQDGQPDEIGAVFPCGHVFHIKCWQQYTDCCKRGYREEKCPNCNQVASLFSRIYIRASSSSSSSSPPKEKKPAPLSADERLELERYRQLEREAEEDRLALYELEQTSHNDPEGLATMTSMLLLVQSKDLRKAELDLAQARDECESTKEILTVTQLELEDATKELADLKPKTEFLTDELDRLKRVRREAATMRQHQHAKQLAALQEKVDRYKEKCALKNRQLARRNKELVAKRKLISAHKMEIAAKGVEVERVCERTKEELQRTKKELQLLRELDDLSSSSFVWD